MDGLPLALATAGAYLDQVSTSFTDYIRLYKASWLKLQQTSPQISSYEDRQLYSTWQLSLDHIEQQNKNSAMLLRLWAYFDNQDLWYGLLREGRNKGHEWLDQITEDELSFNEAVRVLCDHGLVEVDKSSKKSGAKIEGYEMHSCVHSWTIHMVNQEWDTELASLALMCIYEHVPKTNYNPNYFKIGQRLLRHASRCWALVMDNKSNVAGNGWALLNVGRILSHQERLYEAEAMYRRVFQDNQKDDTLKFLAANNLGAVYVRLGQFDKAAEMYQQALEGYKRGWGLEHESTLRVLHNLGGLYRELRQLDKAEEVYLQVLQGKEKVFGPEHTSTLNIVHDLGDLYRTLGRLKEAEKMLQRALRGIEKVFGPEHTKTFDVLYDFGVLYIDLGQPDRGEQLLQRVLQGREKVWGLDHYETLSIVYSLGVVYENLGRLDKAEEMYKRALGIYEKPVQKRAPVKYKTALHAMKSLASLYVDKGRVREAEELYSQVLIGIEAGWGRSSKWYQEVEEVLNELRSNTQ